MQLEPIATTSPGDDDLARASAVTLARWLRERRLSSVELTEHTIRAVTRVNPALNAIVFERFDDARREARDADARLARGETAPLLGVPCTIKEFFAVRGATHTGGLVARRDRRAESDAPVVARLKEAGAIIVGLSNVPEGGIWFETYNALYGRTNNPWDVRRTSGGSSGGEGAIVGAGASPFGLGSDIGGSVRLPAAFCGIVGHKPSGRLVPNSGQFPAPSGEALAMLTPGPMVRRVEDVMPILRILAGPDGQDPVCRAMALGDPGAIDPATLTVFTAPTNGRFAVTPEVAAAVHDAAKALARRGAKVCEFDVTKLARGVEIWAATLTEHAEESYDVLLADGRPEPRINVALELGKALLGRSQHTLPALVVAAAGSLAERFGAEYSRRFFAEGKRLGAELRELLGERGVLLHPPFSRTAPRHNGGFLVPFHPAYTALWNALEMPSTVVPVGLDREGMPLSVQVIAKPGSDHVSIAAAQVIEEAYGGYRPAMPGARG